MRRSICYSEPAIALAGERKTWRFIYAPGATLPKGTAMRFDLGCRGRSIDWQAPSANFKEGSNVIWAELENGKKIYAEAIDVENSIVPQYEFVLPVEVPAGKQIAICLGTPSKDEEEHGNMAQLTIQRRRPFYLFVDPSGKGNWPEPEVFTVDIKGNSLHTIKILTPSQVVKNRRFDVVLRFEDIYGNLTNNAPENTLIELSHNNLRDNLKWKLFLPETGYIALPNLYFNEIGVYTIFLKNLTTGEEFKSSPIKCFASDTKNVFWGTLHGESERFDSTENIESCLRHFRDEQSMNFYSTSSPDSAEETPNDIWKSISLNVAEFNEEDRFAAFLGQQWNGSPGDEGSRIIIHNKDDRPIVRSKDVRSNSLKKVYKLFSPKEIISIPSFTMSSTNGFSFDDFHPEFERVCEIYNAWGSSECTVKEGNTKPVFSKSKKGANEFKEGSLLQALKKNRRFGFIAGGLDDRAIYTPLYDTDQKQYSPGITAILADQYNRQALFDSLYNRNCYATTGERIIVGFSLAGHIMGSELSTAQKPGLHINRHISGYIAGTSELSSVEVIRNGEVIHSVPVSGNSVDFEYDDLTPLQDVSLKDDSSKGLFSFYYIRATQKDGHMAWSSPIWVDCVGDIKSKKSAQQKSAASKKPLAPTKPLFKDEDEFSEEEEEEDDLYFDDSFDDEDEEDDEDDLPPKKASKPKKPAPKGKKK